MTTIFVTGDRSLPAPVAFRIVEPIMQKLLMEHPEGLRFVTGDAVTGIERAVRFYIPEQFLQVVVRGTDAEGHTDWDAAAKEAAGLADEAVVIHTDPLNSRLAKSVSKFFDKVELPLEGIINAAPKDASSLTEPNVDPMTPSPEMSEEELAAFNQIIKMAEESEEKKSEE